MAEANSSASGEQPANARGFYVTPKLDCPHVQVCALNFILALVNVLSKISKWLKLYDIHSDYIAGCQVGVFEKPSDYMAGSRSAFLKK